MRRTPLFIVLALSLAILLPHAFAEAGMICKSAIPSPFIDMTACSAYFTAVNDARSKGIIQGYADKSFQSERHINRAEFTKIIVAALASKNEIDACPSPSGLSDVSTSAWYSKFVCVAQKRGWIAGYPDGTFRPQQEINFVEAAKIFAGAYQLPVQKDDASLRLTNEYLPVWYLPYTFALARKDATPPTVAGYDQPITRGEMAEILFRLTTGNKSQPPSDANMITYYSDSGFAVDYPADIFTSKMSELRSLPVSSIPEVSMKGVALIHAQPVEHCTETEAPCTPLTHDLRFDFYVYPASYFTLKNYLSSAQGFDQQPTTVSGREGVKISLEFEGDATYFYIVPMDAKQTLVIMEVRDSIANGRDEFVPLQNAEEIINSVLTSIRFNTSAPTSTDTTTIQLYFNTFSLSAYANKDRPLALAPVTRTVNKTPKMADLALRLLFQGPTEEGFYSSNELYYVGGAYQSMTIVDGTATLNFTDKNHDPNSLISDYSPEDQQKFKQFIEKTLFQFPSIKRVRYMVDGKEFAQ